MEAAIRSEASFLPASRSFCSWVFSLGGVRDRADERDLRLLGIRPVQAEVVQVVLTVAMGVEPPPVLKARRKKHGKKGRVLLSFLLIG